MSSMKPSALIVSERLGVPYQDAVAGAVHSLLKLMQSLRVGVKIHCTTLDNDEKSTDPNVNLIYPTKEGRLKTRDHSSDFLFHHESYFPKLKELQNVKVVFGFGMVSSDAALRIVKDRFPSANFLLINVWSPDAISPCVIQCDREEIDARKQELLMHEFKEANAIFSIGSKSYEYFLSRCDKRFRQKHFQMFPEVINPYNVDSKKQNQVVSVLHEHDLEVLGSGSIESVIQAMQVVEQHFKAKKSPLVWKLIGVVDKIENKIKNLLEKYQVQFQYQIITSNEVFTKEICCSKLVLILPTSTQSLHVAVNAMALATCVCVNRDSDVHHLISTYFKAFEDDMVVDMLDTGALSQKIISLIDNPQRLKHNGDEIKRLFQSDNIGSINDDIIYQIRRVFESNLTESVREFQKRREKILQCVQEETQKQQQAEEPKDTKIRTAEDIHHRIDKDDGNTSVMTDSYLHPLQESSASTSNINTLAKPNHAIASPKNTSSSSHSHSASYILQETSARTGKWKHIDQEGKVDIREDQDDQRHTVAIQANLIHPLPEQHIEEKINSIGTHSFEGGAATLGFMDDGAKERHMRASVYDYRLPGAANIDGQTEKHDPVLKLLDDIISVVQFFLLHRGSCQIIYNEIKSHEEGFDYVRNKGERPRALLTDMRNCSSHTDININNLISAIAAFLDEDDDSKIRQELCTYANAIHHRLQHPIPVQIDDHHGQESPSHEKISSPRLLSRFQVPPNIADVVSKKYVKKVNKIADDTMVLVAKAEKEKLSRNEDSKTNEKSSEKGKALKDGKHAHRKH